MNKSAVQENKNIYVKWRNRCVVFICVSLITFFLLTTSAFGNNYTVVDEPLGDAVESYQIFYSNSMKMTYNIIFIILGLTYFSLGLGTLLAPEYYKQIMANLKTSKLIMYLSGFFALAIGLLLVIFHNFWVKDIAVIVTIIGWLALIKGITILVLPKLMTKIMDIFINVKNSTLRIIAGFIIILGALLTYIGF